MPVTASLVLLLLAMLWPFPSAQAQERRWTAMETKVRGIVFRIPRAHLHIRFRALFFEHLHASR